MLYQQGDSISVIFQWKFSKILNISMFFNISMRKKFIVEPLKTLTNQDIQISPAENRVFPITVSFEKRIRAL